jgi:hypothetical protein
MFLETMFYLEHPEFVNAILRGVWQWGIKSRQILREAFLPRGSFHAGWHPRTGSCTLPSPEVGRPALDPFLWFVIVDRTRYSIYLRLDSYRAGIFMFVELLDL